MTTNSSPPRRAASAPSGSDLDSTSATSRSSESPNSWPARSLISLKSSQSMTSRLSGSRRSCAASISRSRRSSRPRRLRIPVSGSVTALRRSRCSANAASSEAATCAASTAAVSSRFGSTCAVWPQTPTSAPSSPAFARSGSQTATVRSCRPGSLELRAPGRRRSDRSARARHRSRRPRAVGASRSPTSTHASSTRRSDLVPDEDLCRLDREHARQRRGGERRDLVRSAEAAEVHEEPSEPREVERSVGAERVGQRREGARERTERVCGAVGEARARTRCSGPRRHSPDAQRDRQLGDDARESVGT